MIDDGDEKKISRLTVRSVWISSKEGSAVRRQWLLDLTGLGEGVAVPNVSGETQVIDVFNDVGSSH